jgi:hypothetical protein
MSNRRAKSIAISRISFILAITVLLATPALAKGPVDKLTLEGPGLEHAVEVTDEEVFRPMGKGIHRLGQGVSV